MSFYFEWRQGSKLIVVLTAAAIYISIYYPLIFVSLAVLVIIQQYKEFSDIYELKFRGRKEKSDIFCPSHGASLPKVYGKPDHLVKQEVQNNLKKEILSSAFEVKFKIARDAPSNSDGNLIDDKKSILQSRLMNSSWKKHFRNKEVNPPLDMDHTKLTFWQFAWAHQILYPRLIACNISGYMKAGVTYLLSVLNIQQPIECNYSELVANMLLESCMSLYFTRIFEMDTSVGVESSPIITVAEFVIKNAALVQSDGSASFTDDVIIHIDVTNRRFIRGWKGSQELLVNDAMVVLGFIWSLSLHVKGHSLANWGTNTVPETFKYQNSVMKSLSVITTMYNFYGYSGFPTILAAAHAIGYLPVPVDVTAVIDSGIRTGIGYHGHLIELMPYSQFIQFVFKIRGKFMNEFEQHKQADFPECHGEAFFVGTVMHSLDHTQMRRFFKENFWCNATSENFKLMAKVFFIVLVGFTNDLPLLPVKTRYRDINLPFFQNVYKHAFKINEYLADHMDACICK